MSRTQSMQVLHYQKSGPDHIKKFHRRFTLDFATPKFNKGILGQYFGIEKIQRKSTQKFGPEKCFLYFLFNPVGVVGTLKIGDSNSGSQLMARTTTNEPTSLHNLFQQVGNTNTI